MLFVDNEGVTDPHLNLAFEEYALRHIPSEAPLLLFYINEPAVIIGRNQNTAEEIDPDYIKVQGIHVVRRLSGGGAVYHDLGNLNFSFMTNGRADFHNFAKFTTPVIAALNKLGVPAKLRGKSDIFVADKKISGNAQYATPKRMLSHGTILYNTQLEQMLRALNPRQARIESPAVQSVRAFVTNIADYLPLNVSIEQVREAILAEIYPTGPINQYRLTAEDWTAIRQLAAERYATWQWNYGASPPFNMQKSALFPSGVIDVRLNVQEGRIRSLRIYGNFAGPHDVNELEGKLMGVRHEREALATALADEDLTRYFGPIDRESFLDLLY